MLTEHREHIILTKMEPGNLPGDPCSWDQMPEQNWVNFPRVSPKFLPLMPSSFVATPSLCIPYWSYS